MYTVVYLHKSSSEKQSELKEGRHFGQRKIIFIIIYLFRSRSVFTKAMKCTLLCTYIKAAVKNKGN